MYSSESKVSTRVDLLLCVVRRGRESTLSYTTATTSAEVVDRGIKYSWWKERVLWIAAAKKEDILKYTGAYMLGMGSRNIRLSEVTRLLTADFLHERLVSLQICCCAKTSYWFAGSKPAKVEDVKEEWKRCSTTFTSTCIVKLSNNTSKTTTFCVSSIHSIPIFLYFFFRKKRDNI